MQSESGSVVSFQAFVHFISEFHWIDYPYSYSIHYDDVIMAAIASHITSRTIVYSIVYSDIDQRKHQSSASLAFVWGIHRDRWIPRTKGQLRGKCFHLMTSSYCIVINLTSADIFMCINSNNTFISALFVAFVLQIHSWTRWFREVSYKLYS